MNPIRGVYAIADTGLLSPDRLLAAVSEAIAGGARVIQYRDKSKDMRRRRGQAAALAALCRRTDTVFIVNDDPVLAADCNADGVHIGRDDTTLDQARAQVGPDGIVGLSCYDQLSHAVTGVTKGADYVAFGSFFASRVKPGAVVAPISLLRDARRVINVPIVAIGGITPENGAALVDAGADALAVISAVFETDDPRTAVRAFSKLFCTTKTG